MSEVRNDVADHRYVLEVDGEYAIAAYRLESDVVIFTHTVVPPDQQGHGIGSALIKGALGDARRRGLKVVPDCPFVAAYIERHPEERDLLA